MELSKEEIEAFKGLEESYSDMYDKLNEIAPMCHFRVMMYEECEGAVWWECSFCGHVKEVDQCNLQ